MNLFTLLKRLVFVPTCSSCGEKLAPFPDKSLHTHGKVCFCQSCYKDWLDVRARLCNKCAMPAYKCACIPKSLDKEIASIPALCFYEPEGIGVQNKIIYSLKRKRNSDLVEYFAFELYTHVINELECHNISRESLVFTWIPRRRSAVSEYGFDQSKLLAKALARLFGSRAIPLFLRIGGKEQKKLNITDRTKNLARSLVLNYNLIGFPIKEKRDDISLILKGKNVIIIDDIITTGSSVRQAIDLLSTVFNGKIIAATVGRTCPKTK